MGALALMALSCANKEQPKEKGFDVAQFAVQMSEITAVSATAQVTVTENMDAPWYGFVTADLESSAEEVVDNTVSSLSVGWNMLNTGNKNVPVENLIPGGFNYRYIVTGLAADGRTYGTPAEVNFRTVMDYSVNPDWSVSFIGTVLDEGEYATYYQVSGLEAGGYFGYIVVTAEDYETYGAAEIAAQDAETIIRAGTVSKNICDKDYYYTWDALTPGDYYFIMYGVDKNYYPTMKYTAQAFTVEAATDAYESYVGTWYSIESKVFTIDEETINQSYLVCEDLYAYFEGGYITFSFEPAGGYYYQVALDENGDVLPNYSMLGYGLISEDGKTITFVGAENVAAITIAEFNGTGWNEVEGAPVFEFPVVLSSEEPTPTEAYSAWLGTWYSPGVDPFEIKQGIINNTLLMTGFFKDYEIELEFDKETGNVNFYTQQIGEYEGNPIVFTGIDSYDYVETAYQADPAYLLGTASLSADGKSFELVGNEYVAIYSGNPWDEKIVSMKLFVYTKNDYYDMDLIDPDADDITIDVGTFTDAIPEPSEEYLAWIGNWSVPRGKFSSDADTWTISEYKMNASYIITGIENTPFEVEAVFDKSTGTISISEQTVYSLTTEDDDNIMTVYLYGNFKYGKTEYYWGEGDVLFEAAIDGEGTATMTPMHAYDSYWEEDYGAFTAFGLYAQIGESTGVSSYSSYRTKLPNTMTFVEEPEESEPTALPLDKNQWTKSSIQKFQAKETGVKSLSSSNAKKPKQKEAFKSDKKQGKSLKGEAPQGTGRHGKNGPAYGGGKRGKLNQ